MLKCKKNTQRMPLAVKVYMYMNHYITANVINTQYRNKSLCEIRKDTFDHEEI